MLEARLQRARDDARSRLVRLGVRKASDIDLDAIARDLGAEFLDEGVEQATARVLWKGRRALIRLSDRIILPGKRRFTKGHELGHIACDHQLPQCRDANEFIARACERRRDHLCDPEREADVWSTEANMPEFLVRPICDVVCATLSPARAIAEEFGMSPVASAIRFVELTTARCAAVFAQDGRVKWASRSATFTHVIRKGTRLDPASLAYDYAMKGSLRADPCMVPADAWFRNLPPDIASVEIMEHAEVVPEDNAVLSLIWLPRQSAELLGLAS